MSYLVIVSRSDIFGVPSGCFINFFWGLFCSHVLFQRRLMLCLFVKYLVSPGHRRTSHPSPDRVDSVSFKPRYSPLIFKDMILQRLTKGCLASDHCMRSLVQLYRTLAFDFSIMSQQHSLQSLFQSVHYAKMSLILQPQSGGKSQSTLKRLTSINCQKRGQGSRTRGLRCLPAVLLRGLSCRKVDLCLSEKLVSGKEGTSGFHCRGAIASPLANSKLLVNKIYKILSFFQYRIGYFPSRWCYPLQK